MTKLFPARGSLVSDIPASDGKIANLFYSVVGCGGFWWHNISHSAGTFVHLFKIYLMIQSF